MNKILKKVLFFFAMVFSSIVYASTGYTTFDPNNGPWVGTPQEACQARFDSLSSGDKTAYVGVKTVQPPYNSCNTQLRDNYWMIYSAPDKGPPPKCTAGKVGTWTWNVTMNVDGTTSGPPATGGSDGVCEINITGVKECRQRANKTSYCTYDTKQTGVEKQASSSSDTPSTPSNSSSNDPRVSVPPIKNPPNNTCPSGTVQGGIDSGGISICIGMGSSPNNPQAAPPTTKSPPVTVDNGNGTSTTTTTTTTNNYDGSTTTVKNITTVNNTTNVSTTTQVRETSNTPQSTTDKPIPGKDDSKDVDSEKDNFCKQNPTLSVCSNSTVSGSCDAIACTGDAIQCATLRSVAILQCRDKEDRESLAKASVLGLGQSILAGSDPMKGAIEANLNPKSVDFSNPNLDQSGFLGGGSCFPDKTFSVMGRSVSVSFSNVCQNIQPLRYVFLLIGFISAYMIISKSILQT